jgi:succinate dehydrogenase / fumarate reductase, cytochrome b subunit
MSMSVAASSPAVTPGPVSRSGLQAFLTSSIGLKITMAATGVILSLFVLGHMLGNLQVFQGAEAINDYAKLLRKEPALLWAVRLVLLGAVGLHIWAYLVLRQQNLKARPQGYRDTAYKESSYASRTMRITGPLLLLFIIYHILHFTTGTVHGDFVEGDVYHNVMASFRTFSAVIYLLAMAMLALHLWHGSWSMLQTLGVGTARFGSSGRRFATIFTLLVTLGFASVPLAILIHLYK